MTKDARTGLKPKDRKLATTTKKSKLTANQWQGTPQQNKFMDDWINPTSPTFGNAYESAISAGYSPKYANQIAAPAINNKWIQEYKNKIEFGPEHVKQGLQQLAIKANNSRSPDDTRLKSLETLAKIFGMIDSKNQVNVGIVVQPILGGESVVTPVNQPKKVDVDIS